MKKLSLCLLIALLISISLIADGQAPSGSGTEGNPYKIATLDNLLWMSTNDSSWVAYFEQIEDIDAADTQNWNDGAGFSRIGNSGIKFSGSYDGQCYSIDSLYIYRPTKDYLGLFGYTDSATIINLGVTNVNITGDDVVGGLVGNNTNNSTINNCFITGNVNGDYNIGGLVGYSHYAAVANSFSTGNVDGGWHVGGLVGRNYSSSVDTCYSTVDVTGTGNYIGGLVGECNTISTIEDCYSTGSVNGTIGYVGGLVGYNYNSAVNNSYSTGSVTGSVRVGGLVGYNIVSATVSNCYSTGSASGSSYVGGLVGHNVMSATVSKCYSIGSVSGSSEKGGLVGWNEANVDNSFWDKETSYITYSSGGTGKTTTEMQDVATYTKLTTAGLDSPWDFVGNPYDDTGYEDFWNIEDITKSGYPFLSWQGGQPDAPTNITIFITENDIELSWDDMDANTYYIYRSTNPYAVDWGVAIGSSMVNSYTDFGAAVSGNKYFYYVTASD